MGGDVQTDAFGAREPFTFEFEIRYEGKDAEWHSISLGSLAESLDGFNRIYAVAGHFVSTGQYAKQLQALNAKVYAKEVQPKCFSLMGAVEWASSNGVFSGLGGAVLATIVSVVIGRASGSRDEMKHLRELLEQQLGYNQTATQRLLDTVDRLAVALQPAARKSVAPIGETCDRIDLYSGGVLRRSIDIADKEAILSGDEGALTPLAWHSIVISELDKVKRSCKATFTSGDGDEVDEDGSARRIPCEITDPAAMLEENPYLRAFVSGRPLMVRAKALIKDGVVAKLFISDSDPH